MEDRIDVEQAQPLVAAGNAKLICAYEDDSKCDQIRLAGAISLRELEAREALMPASTELIFYCA